MEQSTTFEKSIRPLRRGSASQTFASGWSKRNVEVHVPLDERTMTKLKLFQFAISLNIPPVFASYKIASEFGHSIFKTPPYHCELQPIEKNQIAAAPCLEETELSLRNRLLHLFATIHLHHLKTFCEGKGKNYWEVGCRRALMPRMQRMKMTLRSGRKPGTERGKRQNN
ncbi:hypothetical protein PsorP6_013148 [Peronosclerospora sorghi]|uniref:Uncharacterized protein n=1 Tax=Peronosclerospora sorghi TaxID=230839 RepID=A0ACC0WGU3_9STRA|nr:hypothetical protein PsorP6_013148 [Peronosclerospora sorghi]